jgi:DNA-binding CsgD family transcriptional regulator
MSEEKKELVQSEAKKSIDVQKALKLKLLGNSYQEIADILGCSKQGVHAALTKFETFLGGLNQGDLQAYAEERRSILNSAELTLLRSVVDEEAIKKAPLASRVMAFGIMYDKRRLEEGKSTENLGILGKLIISSEDELGKSAKDKGSKNNDR